MSLNLDFLLDVLGPDLINLKAIGGTAGDVISAQIYPAAVTRATTVLRDHPAAAFRQLVDITAVHYQDDESSVFKVVYNLLSHTTNKRLILNTFLDESLQIESISSVFPSAIWAEREVWDLFGVVFQNHPDLRRILTDYNFGGHPLRKDFPLSGYTQVRFDKEQQRVCYEPLNLQQPYRDFDFVSPWELPKGELPKGGMASGVQASITPSLNKSETKD